MEWNRKGVFSFLFCLLFAVTASEDVGNETITFEPSDYLLEIKTVEDHFTDKPKKSEFEGEVTISFKINKPTEHKEFEIVLDANTETKVSKFELKGEGTKVEDISADKEQKDGKIKFKCKADALKYDSYTLKLKFTNPFGNDMSGFYRSSYTDDSGKNRWLLTTHFEPIFARNAFPCFDKPKLKANFKIGISVPKSLVEKKYHVLSNTPCENKETLGEFSQFECKKTKIRLSTYLVAFTVSDFKATDELTFDSQYPSDLTKTKKIKTYGQEKIINGKEGEIAQKAGKAALEELTNYLNIGYGYEKVDQVGIPDFSAGAMENWGLILFREKSLFFNEKTGSTATKQDNVLTITHELVHQWFGNLVTLETWDYIWLNEAFATYLGYVISDKIQGLGANKWNYMQQFVVNEMQLRAFETDGLKSSKALSDTIPDESLIYAAFNDIPYSKGASVLRMWDSQNAKGFKESLQEYMQKRKEDFANPTHLFEAFKSKMSMTKETFDDWTKKPGYPVVEVKEVNNEYVLTQSRFLWENAKDDTKWHIPITYSMNNSKPNTAELYDKEIKIPKGENEYIIVNVDQQGYYRVNYEKKNWEALSNLLRKGHTDVTELNRAQIVNDIFSLARSLQKNYVEYRTALDVAKYLSKEKSFLPWKTALNAFDYLQTKIYKDSKMYSAYKAYLLDLIKPHFSKLNPDNLDHVQKLMNVKISQWACSLGYEDCVKEANELYKNVETKPLPPDTQEVILCTVVRNNKVDIWNKIFSKYEEETDSATKVIYLSALGCTDDENQAKLYLKKTLEEASKVRKQDRIFVLSGVYNGNLKNIPIALSFVNENFKKIATEYGGINPLGRALTGLARKLSSKEDLKTLEALKEKIGKDKDLKPALESIENAITMVRSNIEWETQKKGQLKTYFNSGSFVTYSIALLSMCLTFVFNF